MVPPERIAVLIFALSFVGAAIGGWLGVTLALAVVRAQFGKFKPPPPLPRTEDCCVSSTAGRSLMHVGDAWECEKGHRWHVTAPGRAERVPPG